MTVRFIVIIAALAASATVHCKEFGVKRNNSILLPCDTGRIEKEKINVVRWRFTARESPDDRVILEWTSPAPLPTLPSPERYTFNNKTYELDIASTNFDDNGLYICRTFVVDNETESVAFEDGHDLTVYDSPSQPAGEPFITVLSDTEVKIEWQRSEHENFSPIRAYIILIKTNMILTWDDAMRFFVNGNVNSTVKDQLWPYTEYQVRVLAANQIGESEPSAESDVYRTMEGIPTGKPRFLSDRIRNYTTAIALEFSAPPAPTIRGELQGYELSYREHATDNPVVMATLGPNATSYNITDLKPYMLYVISLRIYNGAGKGPEMQLLMWTDEGVPTAPRITNLRNRTDNFIQLAWEKPTPANGHLLGYIIYWSHGGFNYSKRYYEANNDIMTYTLRSLQPYTEYDLRVSALTRKGEGPQSAKHPGLTDVTGPSAPDILNATANSTSSLVVTWRRPTHFFRQVSRYIIYLDNLRTGDIQRVTVSSNGEEVQEEVLYGLEPGTTYGILIAGETKSIFTEHYYQGPQSNPVTKILEKMPATPPPYSGKQPGGGGGGEMAVAGVIAGVICTALLLLVAGLLLLFVRRYLKSHYSYIGDPDSAPPPHALEGVMLPDAYDESCLILEDVAVGKWREHVLRNHADGDLLFSQEYDDINQATRMDLTVHHSTELDNKHKNRYVNIQAYDHSRVVLKNSTSRAKGDYINANYVDGYHQPKAYIAAQGPLPSTFADFWTMVWEQNSSVIIMITNLMERGRRKCDQYWPAADGAEQTYGAVSVRLTDTLVTAHYTVRVFSARLARDRHSVVKKKLSSERTVYQYHYTDWPDHGVPLFTLPVLQFVRKSVAANKEDSGPPIVHCSAGVGRTGTYIVIDSMMRQIADKASLNAFSFLMHIRNQRNYLVQTEDQYIFLHDTLLEHLEAGVTERRDGEIAAYLDALQRPLGGGGDEPVAGGDNNPAAAPTLLSRQFKLVTEFRPQDYHMTSAKMLCNMNKNRSNAILPVDPLRVRLPARPGVPGSDYINASYLQGYNKNLEYIVTQHPMASTVEDFWRMVWDQNSLTIVLLSIPDDEEFPQFWPALKETVEYGHFKVTFIEEATPLSFVTRDFLLQSTQDDYECSVRLVSTSYWPESCEPLSTVFELVQTVHAWDQQQEQQVEGPAIVVDRLGGCEAATFCALSTLYDGLRREGSVDVYQVAKLYHLKRPGMFATLDDYHFLYKAIESIATADDTTSPAGDKDSGISNCNSYPAPTSSSSTAPAAAAPTAAAAARPSSSAGDAAAAAVAATVSSNGADATGHTPAADRAAEEAVPLSVVSPPLSSIPRSVSHTSANGCKAETTM